MCADMADFACQNPLSRNFIDIGAVITYYTSKCRQDHNLYFDEKFAGNGPIFIELWPGEV